MIKANVGPSGVTTSSYNLPEGGRILDANKLWGYRTPYQQKFGGRFCKFAGAKTYDDAISTANNYTVIIPCSATGELPDGYTYMTTRRTDLLEGAAAQYVPSDAAVASLGYATYESQFAEVTLVPIIPGSTASIPVGANVTIALNAEITTDSTGFATVAATTNKILGKAVTAVDNAGGAAGAKFVTVIFNNVTTKA